jgi:hypothetical protein
MAQNTNPIFVLSPKTAVARVSAANTDSSGTTGALVTLFTAGTNGSLITQIKVTNAQIVAAASSAMVFRVFVTDAAGLNPTLHTEVALPAATRTVAAIGATVTISLLSGLLLEAGQIVKVAQSVFAGAQDLNAVTAIGGDY